MFSGELFDKLKYNLKSLDYDLFTLFEELFSKYRPLQIRNYLFDDDERINQSYKKI